MLVIATIEMTLIKSSKVAKAIKLENERWHFVFDAKVAFFTSWENNASSKQFDLFELVIVDADADFNAGGCFSVKVA